MKPKTLKIALTAVVFVLALSGLMYSSLRDGTEYFTNVDEAVKAPQAWKGKKLNLHGFVVEKSILRKPDTLEYRFHVQHNGKVLPVSYTGVVPDTFKDGAEVVLKGHLRDEGFAVDPNGVVAKCPSKYEEEKLKARATGT
ncbi:MAG TPA: cytochrome c maturation protein CcmE [Vicinamibacterales bacterium]|jgi:cytochrome c-type biogenesis protein CcmE